LDLALAVQKQVPDPKFSAEKYPKNAKGWTMVIITQVQIKINYSTGTNDKVKTLCSLFKSFSKKRVADPELFVLNPDLGSYLSSHRFSSGKYAALG
jgi:hypothetical protein